MKKWYVADFETTTMFSQYYQKFKKTRVLLWCMTELRNNNNYQFGTRIDEYMDVLLNKYHSSVVYFHNLSYDGDYILKYLVKIGFKIVNDENLFKPNRIMVFRQGGVIYHIRVMYVVYKNRQKYRYTIDFKCSYRLLNAKVSVLGDAYGIKKHMDEEDSSFYDVEPQDNYKQYSHRFIEYAKNDVEIVRLSLLDFENTIKNLKIIKEYEKFTGKKFNVFNKLTAASISFQLMKIWLFLYTKNTKETIGNYLTIYSQEHKILKPFFKGGYSEFNKKYQGGLTLTDNVLMIDINSAYPYQMTKALPYGTLSTLKPTDNSEYVEWLEINVKSAYIKNKYSNIPFLFNWSKSKFYNPKTKKFEILRYVPYLQNFTCYYTREEWDVICKIYAVKVNSMKVYYQKKKPYLKEFIEDLYFWKAKYKEENKKGLCNSIKIILNSAYGGLAKRLKFDSFYYNDEKWEKDDEVDNLTVKNECKNLNIRQFDCYRLGDLNELQNDFKVVNVGAAAYITSLERVYLMNKILSLPNPNKQFALSDTDSILIVNLDDKTFNQLLNERSKELGGWDVENNITSKEHDALVSIFGAKKYAITDKNGKIKKIRFAGINSREYLQAPNLEDWSEDSIRINNASLQTVRLEDGIILVPKDKVIMKGKI